jgi:hypothetical protein
MITATCQRWCLGRDTYRPAGEPIDPRRYEVAPIPDDTTARAFVEAHHYSGSYPAARFRFGLHRAGELVGIAVFSHPMHKGVFRPLPAQAPAVELGRFVLLDVEPANSETWFLARCFEALRRAGVEGCVAFSDPTQRTNARGVVVFGGHLGTIYQAHNAVYCGRATPRTLRLLPSGQVLSERALSKLRKLDQGWRYAAGQLEAAGAAPFDGANPAAWLATWLPRVTRPLRHPGNHKYVWPLARSVRRSLPASVPYPKAPAATQQPLPLAA